MAKVTIHATPSIALVGRKNVGKSSLFNRLIERNQAIVSDVPGTTRDVGLGTILWRGRMLTILDTGGLDTIKQDQIETNVRKQALRAAKKAHLIVFVVDAQTGPLSTDLLLAKELRKLGPPVVLAVNKADSPAMRAAVGDEWKKLGYGAPEAVSAVNGGGTGDLLDRVFAELDKIDLPLEKVEPEATIAFLGRPNVGKSSLLNAILGEERVIVSEIPHTTREPQDTLVWYEGRPIMIYDTAGVRKRANVLPGLEAIGVGKSLTAVQQADVVFLVLDVTEEVGTQDKHLAGLAAESGKGIVVVLNKWDKIPGKATQSTAIYEDYFLSAFPFLKWAPVIFTSAKSGQRVDKLLGLALRVKRNRERTLTEEELDRFADTVAKPYFSSRKTRHLSALGVKQKTPYLYGIRQVETSPPSFMLIVKDKDAVSVNDLRYVENRLRESFDFDGTPIFLRSREIEK